MKRKIYLILIISALAALGQLFFTRLGFVPRVGAQIVRTTPPVVRATPTVTKKPVVIKSRGVVRQKPETADPVLMTQPISTTIAEKTGILTDALKDAGLASTAITPVPFLILGPRSTYVENKGWIYFMKPAYFTAPGNYVLFDGKQMSQVLLGFKPQRVGQWFLVDCSIDGHSKNVLDDKFRISASEGDATTEVSVVGKGHLQTIVVAQTTNFQVINIERLNGVWVFYSCEITTPN